MYYLVLFIPLYATHEQQENVPSQTASRIEDNKEDNNLILLEQHKASSFFREAITDDWIRTKVLRGVGCGWGLNAASCGILAWPHGGYGGHFT